MTALAVKPAAPDIGAIEAVLIQGDLARLTQEQRVSYYKLVCESVGLNPLTQPFEYIPLNGKLKLYAKKDCTDQLRRIHGVSVLDVTSTTVKDVHVVTAKVQDKTGRTDVATGAVALGNLSGESLANAIMKAETKAKRRATLSICGLGLLDEVEVDDVPGAREPSYTPPPARAKAPPKKASAPPSTETSAPDAASSEPLSKPAAPTPSAPGGPESDPEWVELVQRVRELLLKHEPEGMGWHPKHAAAWLKKYFGVERPIDLTKAKATDACLLVMTRLRTPELYPSRLEQFHSEGRILTDEYEKEPAQS